MIAALGACRPEANVESVPHVDAAPVTPDPGRQATSATAASASPSATTSPPPAAVWSSTEPTLPEGFVPIAEAGETTTCGSFRVQVIQEKAWPDATFVRVLDRGGRVVYEAHGRKHTMDTLGHDVLHETIGGEFCGDLTGDGVPELAMTESSMGAHCCYTHYVVSLTSPTKNLLMWEKGDAGTRLVPVKLTPGPTWQLEGWVVFWPPFDAEAGDPILSYATAPILPALLSLENGAYALTSLSFPEVYERKAADARAKCAAAPDDCSSDHTDLVAFLASVAAGTWKEERPRAKNKELAAQLDKRAAATRKKLEQELGTRRAPAPVTGGKR